MGCRGCRGAPGMGGGAVVVEGRRGWVGGRMGDRAPGGRDCYPILIAHILSVILLSKTTTRRC